MGANSYGIDYNDERFQQVEGNKQAALSDIEQIYGGMINSADSYYQAQIDASKEWANKQTQLQQQQTDFTIEQIEQQKEKENADYIKEQSGAYVDWQKQSNQYGVNAEKQATSGLKNTGYSESSQVSMYNTYQNRVATAREAYKYAVLNYDNAIKDARLQNSAALAEIAYNALQQQLELSLQGFQYKNNLILEQANKKLEIDQIYYDRWLDVLNQLNNEALLAEEQGQFNLQYGDTLGSLGYSGLVDGGIPIVDVSGLTDTEEEYVDEGGTYYPTSAGGYQPTASFVSTPISDSVWNPTSKQFQMVNIDGGVGPLISPTPGGSKSQSSEPTINEQSLNNLGIPDITVEKLGTLIRQGLVNMILKNNQYYFSWAASGSNPNAPALGKGNKKPATMITLG